LEKTIVLLFTQIAETSQKAQKQTKTNTQTNIHQVSLLLYHLFQPHNFSSLYSHSLSNNENQQHNTSILTKLQFIRSHRAQQQTHSSTIEWEMRIKSVVRWLVGGQEQDNLTGKRRYWVGTLIWGSFIVFHLSNSLCYWAKHSQAHIQSQKEKWHSIMIKLFEKTTFLEKKKRRRQQNLYRICIIFLTSVKIYQARARARLKLWLRMGNSTNNKYSLFRKHAEW